MEPSARTGRRIRVGVAGLGAVAQAVHLPLLARLPDRFEIAALADLSPSLRDAMGERYRVPPTARVATVAELLQSPGLDAVILLTSGSHGADALAALDRGLPVLCEKPLAFTVAEADRLAASPNADRLLLGYMKTFDPAVVEARRLVKEPVTGLGDLRAIEVAVLHPTSAAQLAFAHLRPPAADADPAMLGGLRAGTAELVRAALGDAAEELGDLYAGILLGSIVHEWSVIRAVAGDVVAVDRVDAWGETADDPGSVLVLGRLGDGTRVSLGWHYLPGYPAYREDVRFHFVGGSVELTFPAPYRLHEPTLLTVSTGYAETRRRLVFDSIEEAFERELLAFHQLVVEGSRPTTGIADGRTDIVTSQRAIARWAERLGIAIGGEAGALADQPAGPAEPTAGGIPA
jgi:myo-inositol 2-dehydrogenase / D-chiro-inositol 1-dehydrogenase